VKSFKAKGKRLTTYTVGQITELEPTRMPEPEPEEPEKEEEGMEEDESQEDDGQMKLF
jgi:topoisomerase-4 subunit A